MVIFGDTLCYILQFTHGRGNTATNESQWYIGYFASDFSKQNIVELTVKFATEYFPIHFSFNLVAL